MKTSKSEIERVVREQAIKAAVEGAKDFPTTSAHWEEFQRKLQERKPGADTAERSAAPSPFSLVRLSTALGALAAVAMLFALLVPQKSLNFSEAQGLRGGDPNAPATNEPGQVSGLFAKGPCKVALDFDKLSIALPLADGSVLQGSLKPAPELNTAEDLARRYFQIVDLPATLPDGRKLTAAGTLQIVVHGLPAGVTAPKRLRDVQSAILKLDLSADGGPTQTRWYEFTR